MPTIFQTPSAWFEVFERAVRDGDIDRETIARRELQRLGVVVFVDFRSPLVNQQRAEVRTPPVAGGTEPA